MKANLEGSGLFPDTGPTSTAWMHKKLELIKRGGEGNLARAHRMAQEELVTARADEERQISELTTARRAGLIGDGRAINGDGAAGGQRPKSRLRRSRHEK